MIDRLVLYSKNFWKAIIIAVIILSLPAHFVLAQEDHQEAVQVLDTSGKIDSSGSNYVVMITGQIQNTLPLGIADVEIVAIFPKNSDIDPEYTTLERIAANSIESFAIAKHSSVELTKYVTYVSRYRLVTTDLDLLFEYFWETEEDTALRSAAAQGISALPPQSLPQTIKRFEETPSILDQNEITVDLIEDLLLIPVLSNSNKSNVAQSLLDATKLYSQPIYEVTFSEMLTWAEDGDTIIPLLNEAAREKKLLIDLLGDALYTIRDPALPALIKSAGAADRDESRVALSVLQRLGRDTVEAQLEITDPKLRLAVIHALGQTYDPKVVLPMLSVALTGDPERRVIKEILSDWGLQATPKLIEGLNLPKVVSRQLAAEILIAQGEEALPAVQAALTELGLGEAPPISIKDGVEQLVRFYEEKWAEQFEVLRLEGVTKLEAGDCTGAVETFNQLITMGGQLIQGVDKIAEAYKCVGDHETVIKLLRQYLTINPRDEAADSILLTTLLQEANRLNSEVGFEAAESFLKDAITWHNTPDLRDQLTALYIEQGIVQLRENNWENASAYFEQVVAVSSDPIGTRNEMVKTVAREKWLFMVIFLIGTVTVGSMIIVEQKLALRTVHYRVTSYQPSRTIRNAAELGAVSGLLYATLRTPGISPTALVSLAFLLLGVAFFVFAVSFLIRKPQLMSELLPWILVLSLGIGLLTSGQSLISIGFGAVVGLVFGALLGIFWHSKEPSVAVPILMSLVLFLLPPITWPYSVPLEQLAATIFLLSMVVGLLSLLSSGFGHAASYRLFVYIGLTILCGYVALSQASIIIGSSTWIIWGLLIGFVWFKTRSEWSSFKSSLIVPGLAIVALILLPEALPQLFPLRELAVTMFLASMLVTLLNFIHPSSDNISKDCRSNNVDILELPLANKWVSYLNIIPKRFFAYIGSTLLFGYLAVSGEQVASMMGINWIIWSIIIAIPIGVIYLLDKASLSAHFWPWPYIFQWQSRWALCKFFSANQGQERRDVLSKTLLQVLPFSVDSSILDTILWLTGRSLVFHDEIDRVLNQFEENFLRQNPEARYLAQQVFLDLPNTLDKTLLFYIEMSVWFDKRTSLSLSGSVSIFDPIFLSRTWPAFVNARKQTINRLARSGDLNKRLRLPPGQKISSPYTAEGIFLDYADWTDRKLEVNWHDILREDLSPSTLLKEKPEDAKQVEAFIAWLDEIKSLRDTLLEMIWQRNEDKAWSQRLERLDQCGERGVEELLAFVRLLEQKGLYFEAIDLSQAFINHLRNFQLSKLLEAETLQLRGKSQVFISQFLISQIHIRFEAEIAQSEFQLIIQKGWSESTQLQVVQGPLVNLDSTHLHIVNETLNPVLLHILVHGPTIYRFDLDANQEKTLSIKPGQYQVVVCTKDAKTPPIRLDWSKDKEGTYQLSAQLIGPSSEIIVKAQPASM